MRIASDLIEAEIEPERGMLISRLAPRGGPNVLWQRPDFVSPARSGAIGEAGADSIDSLHDLVSGGWFELSPHAGLPGQLDGEETHLHGEALRLAWMVTSRGRDFVRATVRTQRRTLQFQRVIRVEGNAIVVWSRITNVGPAPVSCTHGEHPSFDRTLFAGGRIGLTAKSATVIGSPLASPGGRPPRTEFVWPGSSLDGAIDESLVPAERDGVSRHVSVRLGAPEVAMIGPSGVAVELTVNLATHPFLLIWRDSGSPASPGFGAWDVIALEPMSGPGVGVGDAVMAAATTRLRPGQVWESTMSLRVTAN